MRNDIILKLQRIIEGNDRITWDLFPDIYDGFLEADELSLAEDRMLQIIASTVQRCSDDKIVSTATEEKIAEYESEFGLSSDGLTLDQRRQQVIDYFNRSRIFNESTLHELCQSLLPDFTVYEKISHTALTLGIYTEEEDEGALPAVGIIEKIRPTVPQNLAIYTGTETSFDRDVVINHANFSALSASLGYVEWHEPPDPPIEYTYFGGDFSGNNISLDSVDGGGSVISRYNPGRDLFELRGWEPGGCFWDVLGNFIILDSVTGNVLSSVQIYNIDLPIEIDVLEQPGIIDPTVPEEFLIGVTTECPAGATSLNSEYFWMYRFNQANSSNWYYPQIFQNNEPPYYQTNNTMYPVGGSKYLEVILTNGIGGTFSPTQFKLAMYSGVPEFYMDTAYTSGDYNKNGAVVRYGSDIPTQSLNLPSDMYTISGTTITWNMSHPLMILLQGKPFEYV